MSFKGAFTLSSKFDTRWVCSARTWHVSVEQTGNIGLFFHEAFIDISHRLGWITPLGVFFDAFPGLKMWDTFACTTAKKLTHFIISIAVLENVPPWGRVTEKSHFSTLNVGLSGTGNQTKATCLAGSVARRSAIHYGRVCSMSKLVAQTRHFARYCKRTFRGGLKMRFHKQFHMRIACKSQVNAILCAISCAISCAL
jgi:hypothetical protein